MQYPTISIVTPTLNQGQYIEQTIQSVLNQRYPSLEYLIIDGGSTDGTIDIIKKYESEITFWMSGKDGGQANAINRGLTRCTGEICNWLNSDDYLQEGALFRIAEAFSNDAVDVVAGKVNCFSDENSEIVSNQLLTAAGLLCWKPGVQFVQPGVWMRREHILNCGGIDEQFHYAFDWDLMIRYLSFFPRVAYLEDTLVNFRLHEQSKTVSCIQKFTNEEQLIIEKIYADMRFSVLHPACKWKTERTQWTKLLYETANASNRSRLWKLKQIVYRLPQQSWSLKMWRMTLGALRQIIFYNRLAEGYENSVVGS